MDTRLQENLKDKQHNYIAPFLWLDGEKADQIINEIEHIYESGIRSVCLESRTHEDFLKEHWWSDIKIILDECKKRNMNVWILDDKHYPTGYANGIFAEKYQNMQAWGITERHIDIAGPIADGAAMATCWLTDPEDEFVSITAIKHIPNSDSYDHEIIDLYDGLSGDMLYFTLPEGMWRIVFMIKTRRGISEPSRCFCDMLNPKAVDLFIEEVYQPHYDRFKEYFGNTFSGFFSDEPGFRNNSNWILNAAYDSCLAETGKRYVHHPWGIRVDKRLKALYGDRAQTMLVGLWFDIAGGLSEKIRFDFMNIVTDEYKNNFCNNIARWCHSHGVEYIGHVIEDNNVHAITGCGTGHYFRALDGQDMSGIDVVLHQIVPGLTECANAGFAEHVHLNSAFFQYYLAKLGSSMAHMDEKKKGRAMCEIFGAYGWAEGTKIMKYLMDHMLVRGINYFVPHAFSPKPNDPDCPPNFYDTGNNPEYKFFQYSMHYMNRMCYLLSDGIHVSTCAILYDAENRWVNQKFLPLEHVAKKLYDNLYDYDIIPADYIDKIDRNGCLNGEKYNVLIVPYSSNIPEYVLEKLKHTTCKVIIVSDFDNTVATSDFEIVTLDKLPDYMEKHGYYDVRSDYNGIYLRYYHYTRNGADFYMFSNEDINHTISTKVTLPIFTGGKYIVYDAFENIAYAPESSSSQIEISLPPYHSVVLLFGDVSFEGLSEKKECTIMRTVTIAPEFRISVAESNTNEYSTYKTTDKLVNITGAEELPHFSGHIKYETELELETTTKCSIDLGYVGEVAELYMNDKYVGTKLFPPYVFDISETAVKGVNKMTVVVSNHNGYERRDMFSKYLLFEPSGMLGPINIFQNL